MNADRFAPIRLAEPGHPPQRHVAMTVLEPVEPARVQPCLLERIRQRLADPSRRSRPIKWGAVLAIASAPRQTQCVEFPGRLNKDGYGVLKHEGKSYPAHRVSYCQANGLRWDAIKGLVVRHSCDNPRCINPTHLIPGTQIDNIRDMHERGRYRCPRGDEHVNAKLTQETVNFIRANYVRRGTNGTSAKDLAVRFGIHRSTIDRVLHKQSWRGL